MADSIASASSLDAASHVDDLGIHIATSHGDDLEIHIIAVPDVVRFSSQTLMRSRLLEHLQNAGVRDSQLAVLFTSLAGSNEGRERGTRGESVR